MSAREATTIWGTPPTWLYNAEDRGILPACRDQPLALFFPAAGRNESTGTNIARAVAICRTCPLLADCREWALEQPPSQLHGIWGGTTWSERRRLAVGRFGEQPEQFRTANKRKKEERAA